MSRYHLAENEKLNLGIFFRPKHSFFSRVNFATKIAEAAGSSLRWPIVTQLSELKILLLRETTQESLDGFEDDNRKSPSLAAHCYSNDRIPQKSLATRASGLKKNVPARAHKIHTNVLYTVHFVRASKGYCVNKHCCSV